MKYRLEYNKEQGMWHYEDPATDNANTHGWVTIATDQEERKIDLFTHTMDNVLSEVKDWSKINIVIKAWEAFDQMYQTLGFSKLDHLSLKR